MPFVSVGGARLHYQQTGVGTDLILIHGLGGDLTIWDAEAEFFARFHRVLRVDVRGFGESDKPEGPYSPRLFAQDLASVMDACGVRQAHVLGISMGGVITQRFGLDFGERVHSLTLVSTSSEVGEKSIAAWQRLADRIERDGFDAKSVDASRSVSPGFATRCPEVVAELGRRNAACDPKGYARGARAVSDYNWTPELARLQMPVLILQGLEDQLTPPGGSVKMSRVLPKARLLMIEQAGHNLPIEQPALFRNTVAAFLAGVDASRKA